MISDTKMYASRIAEDCERYARKNSIRSPERLKAVWEEHQQELIRQGKTRELKQHAEQEQRT